MWIILSSFILILFWDVVVGLEIRLLWEVNELNILMRLKLSSEFIPVLKIKILNLTTKQRPIIFYETPS